jgi:hypothetical protein
MGSFWRLATSQVERVGFPAGSRWSAERQKRVRREDGHELEDWFRAKEEIAIKKSRTATA